MADTITVTTDQKKPQRVGAYGAVGLLSGTANLSSYSSSKTALTAISGLFLRALRVLVYDRSSNGYIVEWDDSAKAFRAYSPGAVSNSYNAPGAASQVISGGTAASPLSYTVPASGPGGTLIVSGGTLTGVTVTRINGTSTYTTPSLGTTSPLQIRAQPTDELIVSGSNVSATTAEFLPDSTLSGTNAVLAEVSNAVNVGTFDWVAVGQLG
jgi:hypothetical protein